MADNRNSEAVLGLISRVRCGDNAAFEELLSMYTPLIEASVAKFLQDELYSFYADDFKQEATMVFYNSILAYDMEQYDVEFGLYAKICITNALVSQFRQLSKRIPERLSLARSDDLFAGDLEDPSAKIVELENLRRLYSVIRKNLSEFEYEVWCLYAVGKSAADIGKRLDKDERSVSNAIYRIRKKLSTLLRQSN